MKIKFAIIFISILLLVFSGRSAIAQSESVDVTMTPEVVSPFVGEPAEITFTLSQKPTGDKLKIIPVEVNVIDNADAGSGGGKDVIATKEYQTDENGSFLFQYIFTKAGSFELELEFTDPATGGNEQQAYEIDVREPEHKSPFRFLLLLLIPAVFVSGYYIKKHRDKTRFT